MSETSENSVQTLADRAAIADVVHRFAFAADTRDLTLFRSCFTERVQVDYSSFDPTRHREMPVDEFVAYAKGLEGFDATQHAITNYVCTFMASDRARCVSYLQAAHFLRRDDSMHVCFVYGYYTHLLTRTEEGWKIDSIKLTASATHGDSRVFEWVGLRDAAAGQS
ncbi:MAG: nuclear transport factor 2 family protein [Steroidobacteraceae bacterium]